MSECAKRTARIGGVTLGEGMPKICVPVMGRSADEIACAAQRAAQAQADVIELRIDSLAAMPDAGAALAACRTVRENAPGIPLLFTLRTARDGGAGSGDAGDYEALLCAVIRAQGCDAIDCELSAGEAAFVRIAAAAKAGGVTLVGSSHAFGRTDDLMAARRWLLRQQELGADVCKAALMTHSAAEAFELARIYAETAERLRVPMIGIAMGPAGVATRIAGACMGSCLTFGTAGEASAPGQLDARRLRTALEIVRDAMK